MRKSTYRDYSLGHEGIWFVACLAACAVLFVNVGERIEKPEAVCTRYARGGEGMDFETADHQRYLLTAEPGDCLRWTAVQ